MIASSPPNRPGDAGIMLWLSVAFLLALFAMCGCAVSGGPLNKCADGTWAQACSGQNTVEPKHTVQRPPNRPLAKIDHEKARQSFPLRITEYTEPVEIEESKTLAVYEIVQTGKTLTVRTTTKEIETLNAADGETKIIRFDSTGIGVQEYVLGAPKANRNDGREKARRWKNPFKGFLGKVLLIVLAIGGIMVFLKFRGGDGERSINRIVKLMTLDMLTKLRRRK